MLDDVRVGVCACLRTIHPASIDSAQHRRLPTGNLLECQSAPQKSNTEHSEESAMQILCNQPQMCRRLDLTQAVLPALFTGHWRSCLCTPDCKSVLLLTFIHASTLAWQVTFRRVLRRNLKCLKHIARSTAWMGESLFVLTKQTTVD